MEQIARAYRGLERRMAKDGKGKDHKDGGYLHWYWDDDGYLVIVGRFPPRRGCHLHTGAQRGQKCAGR